MRKVLLLGSGGREHALGWRLLRENCEVIAAPGNPGLARDGAELVSIDSTKPENFPAVYELVKKEGIDLVLVGAEKPLSLGLVDFLNERGFSRAFGPTQAASQLESDKFFSYDVMQAAGIPQANSIKCYTTQQAIDAINQISSERGVVIKARGLAEGKGVAVCDSKQEALDEIVRHSKRFGQEVLIAERMFGQEFSIFGICDGENVLPIECSFQDHKRVFNGDQGPNTGGMGAYGPAPIADVEVVRAVSRGVMTPVIQEMKRRGTPYKGFLYAGMMMTESGPRVIEFNVRFGDPECQPAMMIIRSGFYDALSNALDGKVLNSRLEFYPGATCCVVLTSQGYPGDYKKGLVISGLESSLTRERDVEVFHAGTSFKDGRLVASGGRVLGVTAYSPRGIADARRKAYKAAADIHIPGGFAYRSDIASKAVL